MSSVLLGSEGTNSGGNGSAGSIEVHASVLLITGISARFRSREFTRIHCKIAGIEKTFLLFAVDSFADPAAWCFELSVSAVNSKSGVLPRTDTMLGVGFKNVGAIDEE